MKFFLAGKWQDRKEQLDVTNPANGDVIDTVPVASAADVEAALHSAQAGAKVMAALTAYRGGSGGTRFCAKHGLGRQRRRARTARRAWAAAQ